MMKRYLIIAALLAALAVAAVAMRSTARQNEGAPAYPPVKVALAPALREQAARSYAGVGELEAASQVAVAAETSGRITRILFESGQTVRQGQLLVQLNDAVEQAELVRLQAQLRNADLLLARMRKLMNLNATARQQLDDALAERDMALGAVQETQAKIAQRRSARRSPAPSAFAACMKGNTSTPPTRWRTWWTPIRCASISRWTNKAAPGWRWGRRCRCRLGRIPIALSRRHYRYRPDDRQIPHRAGAGDVDQPPGVLKAGMYAGIRVTQQQRVAVLTVPETALTHGLRRYRVPGAAG